MKTLMLAAYLLLAQIGPGPPIGTSVISGQVRTTTGTPVAGIRVTAQYFPESLMIRGFRPRAEAQTDAAGRYRLQYLLAGRYTIAVGQSELQTYYPGVLIQSGASIVNVADGASVNGIDVSMPDFAVGVSVSGKIITPPDQPLKLGDIKLSTRHGYSDSDLDIAADGAFELSHVPPGSYRLIAISRGTKLLEREVQVSDQDVRGIEFIIPKIENVPGQIVVDDGNPVPPRTLFGLNSGSGTMNFGYTAGQNGTFMSKLPDGEYRLHADSPPDGYYVKSFTYGSTNLFEAPIQIDASDLKTLQITLAALTSAPLAKIRGHVIGPGTLLGVSGRYLKDQLLVPISPDGSFEISNLFPGTYNLCATCGKGYDITRTVVIRDKDVENVDLRVPRVATVVGHIVVEDRNPLPDFMAVKFSGVPGNALLQLHPKEDGSFTLNMPEGVGVFDLVQFSSSYRLNALTYGSQNLLKEAMRVDASRPAELALTLGVDRDVVLAKISGRVDGISHLPAGDHKVVLYGSGLMTKPESAISPDGAFAFDNIPSGTYYGTFSPEVVGAKTSAIQVANQDVTDVQLNVPVLVHVTGQIVVENDGALPETALQFLGVPDFFVIGKLDAKGNFAVTLPAGVYSPRFTTDGPNGEPSALPSGYVLKSITYGPDKLRSGNAIFKVDASNSGPLIITVKLATARVSGRVIGAASLDQFRQIQQVPSVELRISSYPAGSAKFTAPIGADGVFEFPKVPQGKYTATVIPNTPGSIPITINVGETDIGGIVLMVPNVTPTR